MTICARCKNRIKQYESVGTHERNLCAARPNELDAQKCDLVTGDPDKYRYRTDEGESTSYPYQHCQQVNNGNCPDFAPNWWERLKARILWGKRAA